MYDDRCYDALLGRADRAMGWRIIRRSLPVHIVNFRGFDDTPIAWPEALTA